MPAVYALLSRLFRTAPPAVAYRLRAWPDLPVDMCTAPVFRTLSHVGGTPFSARWFAAHTSVPERMVQDFLEQLVVRGEVEKLPLARSRRGLPPRL